MLRYASLAAVAAVALRYPRCAHVFVGAASAYSALWLGAQFVPQAARLLRKVNIMALGTTHFLLSQDKSWPKQPDPGLLVGEVVCTKRIIFVRHGESKWNEVFNKGFGLAFFARFIKAICQEVILLPTLDSVFYDSPLNQEGVGQARRLFEFLQNPPKDHYSADIGLLRGEGVPSVIASSNLRRCLETATVGMWDRLSKTHEKVLLLSCLQEIARNVDTVSMAAARAIPDLTDLRTMYQSNGFNPLDFFDPVLNAGNKTLSSNGLIRMLQFLEWAFQRPEQALIVSGHSLWFKNFFCTFLPYDTSHDCKKRKIVNAGAVAFDLQAIRTLDGTIKYKIDPNSVVTVFGGYC